MSKKLSRSTQSLFAVIFLTLALFVGVSLVGKGRKIEKSRAQTPQEVYNFIKQSLNYWQGQQAQSGNFFDKLDGGESPSDHYGHTHLGATLIWLGLRENNSDMVKRGIKAFEYYFSAPNKGHQPFNQLAVAWAYKLLKSRSYAFNETNWKNYLQTTSLMDQNSCNNYINNWSLVEALAAKEITTTGLPYKDEWKRCETFMVDKIPPTLTQKGLGGDPGTWPTAYHAFSTALIARYLKLTTGDTPNYEKIKSYFLRMVDTQLKLMAPDGDIAFFGRSSEQSFALASMAYSFEVAASLRTTNAPSYKKGASLAFNRLRNYHGLSVEGYINIVPQIRFGDEFTKEGIDDYAHLSVYNGLTLLILSWAYETSLQTSDIPLGTIPSENNFIYTEEGGPKFGVVRYGKVWMIVSGSSYNSVNRDVRYDFGLIRAKKIISGKWVDLLPVRPLILTSASDPSASYKYTLAPRGFYGGIPFVLVGTKVIAYPPNSISLEATLIDRNTFSNLGSKTTITYSTNGENIQVRIPPYPTSVRNFYVSQLFSSTPIRKIEGSNAILTDGLNKLSLNTGLVLNPLTNSDLKAFNNSEVGRIFWDRFEVPRQSQEVVADIGPSSLYSYGDSFCGEKISATKVWSGTLRITCDATSKKEGDFSISLYSSESSDAEAHSKLIAVTPSTSYRVSYWVKTQDLVPNTARAYARVVVSQYNQYAKDEDELTSNRIDSGISLGENISGTQDWALKTYAFTTTSQTRWVRLRLPMGLWGTARGRVWFDDIKIEKTTN